MPLSKADLKSNFLAALQSNKAAGEPTDDEVAQSLADAVGDWLNGYTITVPSTEATLTAPSGPVTGTITLSIT